MLLIWLRRFFEKSLDWDRRRQLACMVLSPWTHYVALDELDSADVFGDHYGGQVRKRDDGFLLDCLRNVLGISEPHPQV